MSVQESASETPRAQVGSSPDRAYLIRCWQEGDFTSPGGARWRFSVEEVLHKGTRRGFADLASLLDYLRTELGGQSKDGACCKTAEASNAHHRLG